MIQLYRVVAALAFCCMAHAACAASDVDIWLEQAILVGDDTTGGDLLGLAVDIDGVFSIVGAPYDDFGGELNYGSSYIFERVGEAWIQRAKLTLDEPQPEDRFGTSVAISGDYAVAGTDRRAAAGIYSGAGYVYHRQGDAWVGGQQLIGSDTAVGDAFGLAVAIDGNRMVIGAPNNDDACPGDITCNSGSAYVFERQGDIWIETAKLTASDNSRRFEFGGCVGVSGDVIVVGGGSGSGSKKAYVFERNGDSWDETTRLTVPDEDSEDFAEAVAVDGEHIVVGRNQQNHGRAIVFRRVNESWALDSELIPDDPIGEYYGSAVSISNDRVIVGAYRDDGAGDGAGAAYAFRFDQGVWRQEEKLHASDAEPMDGFGDVVSVDGGYAIVGALGRDALGPSSGGAYIFRSSTVAFPGDGDCFADGIVDLADFSVLAACVTGPGWSGILPHQCQCIDMNADGDVDFEDMARFQRVFTMPDPSTPATTLQLAGNALPIYPYFEYVRAFNEGEPFEVAVDPSLYPSIAGTTCDLYIVEPRTAHDWQYGDPALADVRPNGPQRVTFSGATISSNTIGVEGGDALSGDAGWNVGAGYDVVLDCNLDALIGEGDYLDGFGDEAGMYVVRDLTTRGPLATQVEDYEVTFPDGLVQRQRTYFPADLESMGPRPLVVIGHGVGMQYDWYEYLQEHLASYGYIVMSHEQDFSGSSAVPSTARHTNILLSDQATIADGVLAGHIDAHRIVWIGHSRGGWMATIAYGKLHDDEIHLLFTADDIVLLSTIAPVTFEASFFNPHEVNFHMLYGSADGDRDGFAHRPHELYEYARGIKSLTYVHGADHHDFNCCGLDDFEGPPETAIGREEAQQVAKATYLAVIKHFAEGNIPAKDYLWRQWEHFKPQGVASTTTVVNEYRDAPAGASVVIEDYERFSALGTSSSGGAVTYDVAHAYEGWMQDDEPFLVWTELDPMNGMTRAGLGGASGVVFDWSPSVSAYAYEMEIIETLGDFTQHTYLSLRACQGTRHPETIAELEDLTFKVTLRDTSGASSSINIGAYGGGIEEPYQRTGEGGGAGWVNEFETIRIRLTDFLHNGSGLDLANVAAIRLEFGSDHGSSRGRLGLDDVELTKE